MQDSNFGSGTSDKPADYFRRLRQLVHRRLIDSIETEGADALSDREAARERIGWLVDELQRTKGAEITEQERRRIEDEILEELGGLGPLAPLMMDPDVSDILVNGPHEVWIDRFGQLEKTDVRFDDEAHLRRNLDRMVAVQGRHLDTASPLVDVRLNDGSRLHAVIPPLCAKGAVVSIRRFRVRPFGAEELVHNGFMTEAMLRLLRLAVTARLNIVISGGAAAGKTTLLNMISRFIPEDERIVTIEETAELRLEHPHVITLEARPANVEGRGGINLRQLVHTALRMRAERIIVGEVRGPEVFDMLQAMNVGHDGSLTTVHANSPVDVLRRLEALVVIGDMGVPREAIREMIGSAIHMIVHLTRFRDGTRRVTSISELVHERETLETRELFQFKMDKVARNGRVKGKHVATEAPVAVLDLVKQKGFDVGPMLDDRTSPGKSS